MSVSTCEVSLSYNDKNKYYTQLGLWVGAPHSPSWGTQQDRSSRPYTSGSLFYLIVPSYRLSKYSQYASCPSHLIFWEELHSFFFIRTKFIRTLSLNFGEILRTFLTLKLPNFFIVLKIKY